MHVLVQIDGLTVRCPEDEVERVRSLIRAVDKSGEVSGKALVLLFSWHRERHRTTPLTTALGWLGAEIVEKT
ncbi:MULTISPECIES: hypothetical protein [Polyangium]|uniref:Uncharacterized protein n=1 Tax=Polyangium fumosum TaxID=889272 RepID=A0A4U1IWL7_9BACT|nr:MULTISPECIES: hypothetical protein [Polyangium]TKC98903.1 hypothetical protein E8A74_39600 [Polyangium fumosum]